MKPDPVPDSWPPLTFSCTTEGWTRAAISAIDPGTVLGSAAALALAAATGSCSRAMTYPVAPPITPALTAIRPAPASRPTTFSAPEPLDRGGRGASAPGPNGGYAYVVGPTWTIGSGYSG